MFSAINLFDLRGSGVELSGSLNQETTKSRLMRYIHRPLLNLLLSSFSAIALLSSNGVLADLPDDFEAQTRAAMTAFVKLKTSDVPKPDLPARLSEQTAEDQEAMMRLLDLRPILGSSPYPQEKTLARIFVFHGQFQHLRNIYVEANSATNGSYASEMSYLMASEMRLIAVQIEALNGFIAERGVENLDEVRKAGLARARVGLENLYFGAISFSLAPELKSDERARVLEALTEVSKPVSSILTPASRLDLIAALKVSVSDKGSVSQSDVMPIFDALANSPCELLCTVE